MTFKEYIDNPMGVKNSVYSNRGMYAELYKQKWDLIMLRENGKVDYQLFKDKDDFYIYLKIPSEVIEKFTYDVVIRFKPPRGLVGSMSNLDSYNIECFSNDPRFVFTFAYAFKKNKMFIEDLSPKMSKEALKEKAKEKNPKSEIGYVKSIYFAYLFMKSRGLFNSSHYIGANKYDKKYLLQIITDADTKISIRQEEGLRVKKRSKRAGSSQELDNAQRRGLTRTVDKVKGTRKANTVSRVKTSSHVGTIKRAKK